MGVSVSFPLPPCGLLYLGILVRSWQEHLDPLSHAAGLQIPPLQSPVRHPAEAHTPITQTLRDTHLAHPSPSMVESAKTLSLPNIIRQGGMAVPEETGKASPGPKTSRARNGRTRGTDGVFLISHSNWRQRPWKRKKHMRAEQLAKQT